MAARQPYISGVVNRGDSVDKIMTRRVFCASLFSLIPILVSFAGFGNQDDAYYEKKRKAMVEIQLQARDIADLRVLDAMRKVPRHLFVDPRFRPEAYEDYPLPSPRGRRSRNRTSSP